MFHFLKNELIGTKQLKILNIYMTSNGLKEKITGTYNAKPFNFTDQVVIASGSEDNFNHINQTIKKLIVYILLKRFWHT